MRYDESCQDLVKWLVRVVICFSFLAFHNKRHRDEIQNCNILYSVVPYKRDVAKYKDRITVLYFVFRPTIPHNMDWSYFLGRSLWFDQNTFFWLFVPENGDGPSSWHTETRENISYTKYKIWPDISYGAKYKIYRVQNIKQLVAIT